MRQWSIYKKSKGIDREDIVNGEDTAGETVWVVEAEDYHIAADSRDHYQKQTFELIEALTKINKAELNSQRPGGGYSASAKLSYDVLKKYGVMK